MKTLIRIEEEELSGVVVAYLAAKGIAATKAWIVDGGGGKLGFTVAAVAEVEPAGAGSPGEGEPKGGGR